MLLGLACIVVFSSLAQGQPSESLTQPPEATTSHHQGASKDEIKNRQKHESIDDLFRTGTGQGPKRPVWEEHKTDQVEFFNQHLGDIKKKITLAELKSRRLKIHIQKSGAKGVNCAVENKDNSKTNLVTDRACQEISSISKDYESLIHQFNQTAKVRNQIVIDANPESKSIVPEARVFLPTNLDPADENVPEKTENTVVSPEQVAEFSAKKAPHHDPKDISVIPPAAKEKIPKLATAPSTGTPYTYQPTKEEMKNLLPELQFPEEIFDRSKFVLDNPDAQKNLFFIDPKYTFYQSTLPSIRFLGGDLTKKIVEAAKTGEISAVMAELNGGQKLAATNIIDHLYSHVTWRDPLKDNYTKARESARDMYWKWTQENPQLVKDPFCTKECLDELMNPGQKNAQVESRPPGNLISESERCSIPTTDKNAPPCHVGSQIILPIIVNDEDYLNSLPKFQFAKGEGDMKVVFLKDEEIAKAPFDQKEVIVAITKPIELPEGAFGAITLSGGFWGQHGWEVSTDKVNFYRTGVTIPVKKGDIIYLKHSNTPEKYNAQSPLIEMSFQGGNVHVDGRPVGFLNHSFKYKEDGCNQTMISTIDDHRMVVPHTFPKGQNENCLVTDAFFYNEKPNSEIYNFNRLYFKVPAKSSGSEISLECSEINPVPGATESYKMWPEVNNPYTGKPLDKWPYQGCKISGTIKYVCQPGGEWMPAKEQGVCKLE